VLDLARGDGQHRPHAQDLLDHGVEVGLVALADAAEDAGVAGQALERPAERAGRGLVAGGEQGRELVAQLRG
jgi:hypothetical protein